MKRAKVGQNALGSGRDGRTKRTGGGAGGAWKQERERAKSHASGWAARFALAGGRRAGKARTGHFLGREIKVKIH